MVDSIGSGDGVDNPLRAALDADGYEIRNVGDITADVGAIIDTSELSDTAVTAAKLAANAVQNSKIASGAVDSDEVAQDAITAAKIAAGAVDSGQLANDAVTAAEIAADAVGPDQLDETGEYSAQSFNIEKLNTGYVNVAEYGTVQDAHDDCPLGGVLLFPPGEEIDTNNYGTLTISKRIGGLGGDVNYDTTTSPPEVRGSRIYNKSSTPFITIDSSLQSLMLHIRGIGYTTDTDNPFIRNRDGDVPNLKIENSMLDGRANAGRIVDLDAASGSGGNYYFKMENTRVVRSTGEAVVVSGQGGLAKLADSHIGLSGAAPAGETCARLNIQAIKVDHTDFDGGGTGNDHVGLKVEQPGTVDNEPQGSISHPRFENLTDGIILGPSGQTSGSVQNVTVEDAWSANHDGDMVVFDDAIGCQNIRPSSQGASTDSVCAWTSNQANCSLVLTQYQARNHTIGAFDGFDPKINLGGGSEGFLNSNLFPLEIQEEGMHGYDKQAGELVYYDGTNWLRASDNSQL